MLGWCEKSAWFKGILSVLLSPHWLWGQIRGSSQTQVTGGSAVKKICDSEDFSVIWCLFFHMSCGPVISHSVAPPSAPVLIFNTGYHKSRHYRGTGRAESEVPAPRSSPGVPDLQVFVPGTCTRCWLSTRVFCSHLDPSTTSITLQPQCPLLQKPTGLRKFWKESKEKEERRETPSRLPSTAYSPVVIYNFVEACEAVVWFWDSCLQFFLKKRQEKKRKEKKFFFFFFFSV